MSDRVITVRLIGGPVIKVCKDRPSFRDWLERSIYESSEIKTTSAKVYSKV